MATKKKVEKEVKDEVIKPSESEVRRSTLIDDLRSRLLTKTQLKQGGRSVRSRYTNEQGYLAIVEEINLLGKELGLPSIGFSDIRKE